jgi:hypothetical protein
VTAIDRRTLGGARDSAFILLGYAGALRSANSPSSPWMTSNRGPTAFILGIRRSKTDGDANGAKVAVARGNHPDTDPIAARQHWLDSAVPRRGRCSSRSGRSTRGANEAAALSNPGDPGLGRHRRDFEILA